MDHSIQAYLQRIPTEKLIREIESSLQEGKWQNNRYAIMMIFAELQQRAASDKKLLQALQEWEKYEALAAALDSEC